MINAAVMIFPKDQPNLMGNAFQKQKKQVYLMGNELLDKIPASVMVNPPEC